MGSLVAPTIASLEVCTVLVRDFGPSDSKGIDAARDFSRSTLREICGGAARALRTLLLDFHSRRNVQTSSSRATSQVTPQDAQYIVMLLEVTTLSMPPGPRGI